MARGRASSMNNSGNTGDTASIVRSREVFKDLDGSMKDQALHFLHAAGNGPLALKFCERFDEKSRIWNLHEHSHPYLELLYFLDGRATVSTGNQSLDVAIYDLVAYPPGVAHQETLDPQSRQEIICLWLEVEYGGSLDRPFKLSDSDGGLGWLCQGAHLNHVRKAKNFLELEDHLLKSLLLMMEQRLESASSSPSAALDRSRAYIDAHCAEDLDIGALARVACVTPSYLSRLYKKHLGTSPMRYRNAVRVEKAKHLLLVKSASVEEVAYVIGFEDPKYFSRLFKAITGLTPSQFRRKYRSS
jgi:AraC-like DNA-binding protein/mannose-6-phosphate isomerase-like protein (cupin superfamily)